MKAGKWVLTSVAQTVEHLVAQMDGYLAVLKAKNSVAQKAESLVESLADMWADRLVLQKAEN